MNELAEQVLAVPRSDVLIADRSGGLSLAEARQDASDLVTEIRAASSVVRPTVAVRLPLGSRAALCLTTAILHDLTVVFLDPAWPDERTKAVLTAVRPHVVIDQEGVRAGDSDGAATELVSGYLAMTSGSTGAAPKGVLAPWASVSRFVAAGAAELELDAAAVWAEPTPLSYDMAITNVLLALASGAQLQLGSTADGLRPLRFATRVGATHVRLAPRSVELAVAERRSAPPSLRVWGSGGDRLRTSHVRAVHELGIPAVVNTYGTSETIGFASAARLLTGADVPEHEGVVTVGDGRVGDWSVQLDSDQLLAIHSEWAPGGYRFGGQDGDGYPRWSSTGGVVTGDIGVHDGTNFFCLGRSGRRVKRHGIFIDLDYVDDLLERAHGVASFTFQDPSGRLLTIAEIDADRVTNVRKALAEVVTSEQLPESLIPVARVPRLANGKVDQRQARELGASEA
ncbi:AMP-binding protein [Luteipulveratus mongoliensis]|nr:AMP-binding protein [Luteipulveratus mongoliensis]